MVRFNRWQLIALDREKARDGEGRGGGDGDEACATNGRAKCWLPKGCRVHRPPAGERSDTRLQRHIGVEGRIERRRMRQVERAQRGTVLMHHRGLWEVKAARRSC
jgi:hypothetical protein